jgi:hypothetical protein
VVHLRDGAVDAHLAAQPLTVAAAAHFTVVDGGFSPTRFAQSHWGDDHLNGPAIVGLVARQLQISCGAKEFHPARLTVNLFRPARNLRITLEVTVIREGRRVRSAECDVVQEGRAVARATLVQYRRSAPPPGRLWRSGNSFPEPPAPNGSVLPFVGSDTAGWTRSPAGHQNDSRKRFFNDGIAVGTATLFDSRGAFGSGMTTAIANPAAQIDFSTREFGVGDLNYE